MIKELTSDAVVEQQLATLQEDIRKNLDLIDELTQIQTKFAKLEATYQEAQQFMRGATSTFGFLQTQAADSIATAEKTNATVHTSLQQREAQSTQNFEKMQSALEQKQSDLSQLEQRVQQVLAEIEEQRNDLTVAHQNAHKQFQQAMQLVESYQQRFDQVEQKFNDRLVSQQAAVERQIRWLWICIIILVLSLCGLCGYVAFSTQLLLFS